MPMIKNQRILAFIPARGGSKGLPRKNVLPLGGKPLVVWTIEQALRAGVFDTVMVSTDDAEIAAIARASGAEVPSLRPAHLAQDATPTIDVILHVIDEYRANGKEFDYVALLEPTSPLRARDDLATAVHQLVHADGDADALVSVGEIHMESPFIAQVVTGGRVEPLMPVEFAGIFQRQQLRTTYFPYGVIYLSRTQTLVAHRKFYQPRTLPYYIQRWQNFEIDDAIDMLAVEAVIRIYGKEME
jgi:CMP-N,N'-diacetyllegionaminic acid synthase